LVEQACDDQSTSSFGGLINYSIRGEIAKWEAGRRINIVVMRNLCASLIAGRADADACIMEQQCLANPLRWNYVHPNQIYKSSI
jgi:hypothetical protein